MARMTASDAWEQAGPCTQGLPRAAGKTGSSPGKPGWIGLPGGAQEDPRKTGGKTELRSPSEANASRVLSYEGMLLSFER